jgi:hypothetical protein
MVRQSIDLKKARADFSLALPGTAVRTAVPVRIKSVRPVDTSLLSDVHSLLCTFLL